MTMWPKYEVDMPNQKHVVEKIGQPLSDRDPDVIAYCDNPDDTVRVRDGLELMAVADPMIWWDEEDWDNSLHPWTESSIKNTCKLLTRFLPMVEREADHIISKLGWDGDWFTGIESVNDKAITVRYRVRGHYGDPNYDETHDIPWNALWDSDGYINEILAERERVAAEREREKRKANLLALRTARQQKRQSAKEKEKRDLREYRRLKAKYEGAANA